MFTHSDLFGCSNGSLCNSMQRVSAEDGASPACSTKVAEKIVVRTVLEKNLGLNLKHLELIQQIAY